MPILVDPNSQAGQELMQKHQRIGAIVNLASNIYVQNHGATPRQAAEALVAAGTFFAVAEDWGKAELEPEPRKEALVVAP